MVTMHIGFTGTREGLATPQKKSLNTVFEWASDLAGVDDMPIKFHHGDCIGADEESHYIVYRAWGWAIEIHPPKDRKWRAFCAPGYLHVPEPYLVRNLHIVRASGRLIACPRSLEQRGGTWRTIEYANNENKPVTLVLPDGRILENYIA